MPETPTPLPCSAHRAFVYAAALPGWGEIYAGAWARGVAAMALCLGGVVWFLVGFARVAYAATAVLFPVLSGGGQARTPVAATSFWPMAVAAVVMYLSWRWAMQSAVAVAAPRRRSQGAPAQRSALWGGVMSALSPGTGLLYAGLPGAGWALWAAHLGAVVLGMRSYGPYFEGLKGLLAGGTPQSSDPFAAAKVLADQVHALQVRADHGLGQVLDLVIWSVAFGWTLWALRDRWGRPAADWTGGLGARAAALVMLGWLCPGAGQLLQGRRRAGLGLLAAGVGAFVLVAALLGAGLIDVSTADSLGWAGTAVVAVAILESLLQLRHNGSGRAAADEEPPHARSR